MTIKSRKESIQDLFDFEKPIEHLLKRQMHQRKDYVDEEKNLSDFQRTLKWLSQRGRDFNNNNSFSFIYGELEEDLFEEIMEIRERGDVDESVISLMYRPVTQKGFILPEEVFKIFDKKTRNAIAVVKDIEIFTIKRKRKTELYIQGRICQYNNGASNLNKIFKGNKIKIFPKGS